MFCRSARHCWPSTRSAVFVWRRGAPLLVALMMSSVAAACAHDELTLPTDQADPVAETPPNAKRWSDPATWPDQHVPAGGADVVIPKGTDVLLDVSPAPLASLRIEGSLTVDERDLEISAGAIHVFGSLVAGSERTPFTHRLTITLTGTDPGGDVPTKMIAVYGGGVLELHGETRSAWTRLASTAQAGMTELLLESAPTWRAGDRVVIASTSYEPNEAEVALVTAVSGSMVSLSQPLHFTHWGVTQSIAGTTLDERAEVGLLSRNIVVRGDEQSEANGFGGHIMMMGGASGLPLKCSSTG